MIHLSQHIRDVMPTAQEVMAHMLFCFLLWGFLLLLLVECLP